MRIAREGAIAIRQEGEYIYLLSWPDRKVLFAAPWRKAELFFKEGLKSCKDAETYMWSLIEGKHIDPDFCKIKRVFDLPVLESRRELETLG